MSIFERFGSTAAASGRGSRPRPRFPEKVRTLFSAAGWAAATDDRTIDPDGQDSHQPTVTASLNAGDRQV
ncbi:MAG: hypothetical protein WBB01_14250 [Phormidesmis sp.]